MFLLGEVGGVWPESVLDEADDAPLTVSIPHAKYPGAFIVGTYEITNGMVHVHYNGAKKVTQIGNMDAHTIAEMLLRELATAA